MATAMSLPCRSGGPLRLAGTQRRLEPALRPYLRLLRIVEDLLRRRVVGHVHESAVLFLGKRLQTSVNKRISRVLIGLEIQHIVGNQCEHQSIVIQTMASEHGVDRDGTEGPRPD